MLRRSRMQRHRTGKNLALTERDFAIFRLLVRYRYLRSTYIHAFVGGASETRFKERLGDLFHEGYLSRPAQQWQHADARCCPAIYELDSGARRELLSIGMENEAPVTFLAGSAHRQFQHSVMICECLASFELASNRTANLRFIAWSEILARAPEGARTAAVPFRIPISSGALVPDGLFGLEYERTGAKAYRFFALELDRGTMPVVRSTERGSSYLGKLAAYRELISRGLHKSHLGVPNLFVLTVTTTERRLADVVMKVAREMPNEPLFLFKALPETGNAATRPVPELLLEPWERAGLEPLRIAGQGDSPRFAAVETIASSSFSISVV